MSFHKFLFYVGAKLRNPSIFDFFIYLKKNEKKSLVELKKENHEKLKSFLSFAYTHSPFYKETFDHAGFNPLKPWDISDFSKLPILEKAEIISNTDSIHTPANLFSKRFLCETSGTTGKILTFFRDEEWDSFNRAAYWRGISWYKVQPWDFKIYFWGYNSNLKKKIKTRFFDALLNRFRVFNYDAEVLRQMNKKFHKVKAIEGYSSMIYEMAKLNQDKGHLLKKIKMVKGTSEKIYPHYQDAVKKAFGVPLINEYGAAECGLIAFECPKGGIHLNLEGVFLETDPTDGGIIVTNLVSKSFPIIRYKLGDVVQFEDENKRCTCGLNHPLLKEITGRIGKNIYGNEKKYPSLTLYYVFKNLYFNNSIKIDFQAHQFEKGKMEIWIQEPVTDYLRMLIEKECQKYFSDLSIVLIEKYEFRSEKGKLKDFISHLA